MSKARYAVYNKTSGDIRKIITCRPALAPINCREEEDYLELPRNEPVNDATHRVHTDPGQSPRLEAKSNGNPGQEQSGGTL